MRWTRFVAGETDDGLDYVDAFGEVLVPMVHGDANSPDLQLQVILRRFASAPSGKVDRQGSSSLGVLFSHCGGPGSDAKCGIGMGEGRVVDRDAHGKPAPMGYDVLGVSQRGVEGNSPGLSCPSMTGAGPHLPTHPKTLPPSLAELSGGCECAFVDGAKAGYMFKDIDTYDEAQVRDVYRLTRESNDRCYNASRWRMLGKDGKAAYHFLDYAGTESFVYDLDLLRQALGMRTLSIYGASYGTMAGAVYASVFPDHVDRVVLDGNMFPFPNTIALGMTWPATVSQVVQHLLENCRVTPHCALIDPFAAYDAVLHGCRRGALVSPPTADSSRIVLTNGLMVGYLHTMAAAKACGWKQALLTLALLADESDARVRELGVTRVLDRMCVVAGEPTWRRYAACIDEVMVGKDTDPIMGTAVLALDMTSRLSVEGGVELWRTAKSLYGADVLGHMVGYTASIATWRATPAPVAPFGSSKVAPLVVGNLFDQATSYVLSQKMAAAFPDSSLLTYQGVGHCLEFPSHERPNGRPPDGDPAGSGECDRIVMGYLRTGVLPRTGHTCRLREPIPVPTSDEVQSLARPARRSEK